MITLFTYWILTTAQALLLIAAPLFLTVTGLRFLVDMIFEGYEDNPSLSRVQVSLQQKLYLEGNEYDWYLGKRFDTDTHSIITVGAAFVSAIVWVLVSAAFLLSQEGPSLPAILDGVHSMSSIFAPCLSYVLTPLAGMVLVVWAARRLLAGYVKVTDKMDKILKD